MSKSGVLPGVQYLRFFAAILVVLHHSWQMVSKVGARDVPLYFAGGASGVDIFFVISGFIMLYITNFKEYRPVDFFVHRIARVAPAYWVATLAMLVVIIIMPKFLGNAKIDEVHIVMSFLFIAWPHPTLHVVAPLLQIGWTLNYEIFFYIIFSLSIFVSYKFRSLVTAIIIFIFCIAGFVNSLSQGEIFRFYTSGIMLEFVFGLAIALSVQHWRLKWQVSAMIAVLGLLALATSWFVHADYTGSLRFLLWGVPAATLFCGVAHLDAVGKIGTNRLGILLGDSSYALYLTHLFVLGIVRKVWGSFHLGTHLSDVVLLAVSAVCSIAGGIVFHLLVEKPLSSWLKKAIANRQASRRNSPELSASQTVR